MADDMGYGDPGCYNPASQIPTPNIDRLAAEGVRFSDAHAPCALCTPSRYGLLTGRYQWRSAKGHALAMPYEPPVIEPERTTLASLLAGQGYHSGCIGKWHLGLRYPARGGGFTQEEAEIDFGLPLRGGPIELGFDTFFGSAGCSTSDAPYCFIEQDRSVGIPTVPSGADLNALAGFYPGLMAPDWRIDDVDLAFVRRAVAFIEERSRQPDSPFFLYLPLSAPHNPWVVPSFLERVSGDGPRGDMNVLVDWCVGQVTRALEASGGLDDTLVMFTSDHGPQYRTGPNGHRATGPFRGHKNTAFEGGHRVPFVARWPDHIEAEGVCRQAICHTDLLATLAELTGAPLPEGAGEDSFSVLPALLGRDGPAPPRPALISDTGHHGLGAGDFAIRRGRWKLIVAAPRPGQGAPQRLLFDLESDPGEERDLLTDQPEVAAELEHLLGRLRRVGARQLQA